jgi:methyl-accepting chemotaxis protein
MKRKFNLQQKIIITVVGVSAIIYAVAIGFIAISSKRTAVDDALALTVATAQQQASGIKTLLEEDLVAMKTLAHSVLSYKEMPEEQWKKIFAKMYEEVITSNPQFLSIWDSWELNHIDSKHNKPYGRYVAEFWRDGGKINSNFSFKSMTGDNPDYARIKRAAIDCIENPYFYSYTGRDEDQKLMTSLIAPIIDNGKYIGVVGVDISLDRYHPIITQIRPFKGSYAFLVANDLQYVAHPEREKHGSSLIDDYESLINQFGLTEVIVNGQEFTFLANDVNGVKSFFVLAPIIIGKTGTPWSLAVVVPQSTILSKANKNFYSTIIFGFAGLLLLTIIIVYLSRSIVNPINSITRMLKRMSKGNVASDMILPVNSTDELGEMTQALNITIDGLSQKIVFATIIGKGDLEAEFNALSDEDALGKALINMRNSLKTAKNEDEKRKVEDQKRRWANEGLAKFGEILRQDNDNLENLSRSIIRELVQTLEANQGGLFLINDDEDTHHFDLTAAFAYNRIKHKQKRILVGEGLIGACALEKKTIVLTEIPDNYIEITSGLGQSTPNTIVIVPLLMEEDVLGVIELASFNSFEAHQVEFLEKVAQSISSTITSVRVNIRTTQLLAKTQQQAEEMAAQEEEMRQNMEELQATQEESTRKTAEMQSFIDAINNSSFFIEYDSLGYITSINNSFLELLGLSREEVIGTHHSDKLELSPEKKKEYEAFWNTLRNGVPQKQTNRFIVDGRPFVFQETYTPIKNEMGDVYKVLKISNNITNLVLE